MDKQNTTSLGFALKTSWALLLGFGILMVGDGLQASLLAIRADQEGFSTTVTGLVMSAFYVGFLSGSVLTPRVLVSVGHIRVFAALAAIASAAILVHAIFVNPVVWGFLRLISGFSFAGLYVVAESWLNDRATNESRGKVLSLYMVVTYLGVGAGQLLLNLAPPEGFELFILVSILVSIAVLPLLLSAGSPPTFVNAVPIRISELYRSTPLGVIGTFIEGLVTATFFALGPVYAQRLGMDVREISLFMSAAVVGTILLQWPVGALSDRFDRRIVLSVVSLAAGVSAFLCVPFALMGGWWPLLMVGVFCGLSLPLYSVCIAYTNDHLRTDQMIAASGTLVLVGGIGAVIGPFVVAAAMDFAGDNSFFWLMGGAHIGAGVFAVFRMIRRENRQSKINVTPTAIHASSVSYESVQQVAVEELKSPEEKSPTEQKHAKPE